MRNFNKLKPNKIYIIFVQSNILSPPLTQAVSEFGCGGTLYPVGGLGSHVSTCTILLTTLPGLTGNRKEGAEQRLSRCSPSQGHGGELHRAVTPASARTTATGPNTSTLELRMTRKTAYFIAHANVRPAFLAAFLPS